MDSPANPSVTRGRYFETIIRFAKQHKVLALVVSALIFIGVVVAASVYANALVWDYFTNNGRAVGMGTHVSVIQTLDQYDALHYTHIAQYGYTATTDAAFPPIYPMALRGVAKITHLSYPWSGLIVSWLSLCAAAVVLYEWLALELSSRKIKLSPWAVLGLIAIFPTSYYFALPYTESLFMLFNIGALFAYRKKQYWVAAILAALASATRYQGLVLCLFFAADYYYAKKDRHWKKLIPVIGGVIGLAGYMIFLKIHYGSATEFLTAEQAWHRLSGSVIKNLVLSFRPVYVWFMAVLGIGLWSVWKYLGKAYFWYCLAFVLVPLSSGRFDSINRFMVCLTPMLLGLAIFGQERVSMPIRLLYICSSVFLLAWSIMLFANGYWVA
jgi:hypothetical protein